MLKPKPQTLNPKPKPSTLSCSEERMPQNAMYSYVLLPPPCVFGAGGGA